MVSGCSPSVDAKQKQSHARTRPEDLRTSVSFNAQHSSRCINAGGPAQDISLRDDVEWYDARTSSNLQENKQTLSAELRKHCDDTKRDYRR